MTRFRRRRATRGPGRQRRLTRPVVSVGNLSMGGTGKTPVVAAIAAWLVARGERPAILSRGYGRATAVDGVVVVSDGTRIIAGLDTSGDEPLMLARSITGAAVCVCADRHLAGVLAEQRLGATVHLLDDGFQHLDLARDLDILVTTPGEIPNGRVLPFGRLREPIDAAAYAHVLVVMGATPGAASSEAWTLGIGQHCGGLRVLEPPLLVDAGRTPVQPDLRLQADQRSQPDLHKGHDVVAVAGIGNPARFVNDVREAGWRVARELTFPDHHRYRRADLARIADVVSETGAQAVLTTDKDAVRFEPLAPLPFPLYRVPMSVEFDPRSLVFDAVAAVLEA